MLDLSGIRCFSHLCMSGQKCTSSHIRRALLRNIQDFPTSCGRLCPSEPWLRDPRRAPVHQTRSMCNLNSPASCEFPPLPLPKPDSSCDSVLCFEKLIAKRVPPKTALQRRSVALMAVA